MKKSLQSCTLVSAGSIILVIISNLFDRETALNIISVSCVFLFIGGCLAITNLIVNKNDGRSQANSLVAIVLSFLGWGLATIVGIHIAA